MIKLNKKRIIFYIFIAMIVIVTVIGTISYFNSKRIENINKDNYKIKAFFENNAENIRRVNITDKDIVPKEYYNNFKY